MTKIIIQISKFAFILSVQSLYLTEKGGCVNIKGNILLGKIPVLPEKTLFRNCDNNSEFLKQYLVKKTFYIKIKESSPVWKVFH